MGASLGCIVTPDAAAADDVFLRVHRGVETPSMRGRLNSDVDETDGLFSRLRRSFSSFKLTTYLDESELSRSQFDMDEEMISWDTFLSTTSSADASSGSRMLSTVYSQALELDHNTFFIDARGEHVRGPYLQQVELVEEYFPSAGRIKVVDDDDRDCCASTMDLETDLDMERFLTQAPPFLDSAVLVRPGEMEYWSSVDAMFGKRPRRARCDTDRGRESTLLFSPINASAMAAAPLSAPSAYQWADESAPSSNAWEATKQRALASYYIGRLPPRVPRTAAAGWAPPAAS